MECFPSTTSIRCIWDAARDKTSSGSQKCEVEKNTHGNKTHHRATGSGIRRYHRKRIAQIRVINIILQMV